MNSTALKQDERYVVDKTSMPVCLYVITNFGEILVGFEDRAIVKHSSLAAGLNVWAAGEVGVFNQKICVVNLDSGHYMGKLTDDILEEYSRLVTEIFKEYVNSFLKDKTANPLASGFYCNHNKTGRP